MFDGLENGVSNSRKVQGDLVGDGGDKWLDSAAWLTAIVSSSTVGCADGGRWSRSNHGDMHRLYLSYFISIFHIGVGSEVKKFYEIRILTFDACEMSLRLFSVGMVLRAYIS